MITKTTQKFCPRGKDYARNTSWSVPNFGNRWSHGYLNSTMGRLRVRPTTSPLLPSSTSSLKLPSAQRLAVYHRFCLASENSNWIWLPLAWKVESDQREASPCHSITAWRHLHNILLHISSPLLPGASAIATAVRSFTQLC